MKHLLIVLLLAIAGLSGYAQSSFPPKSYPASIKVMTDAGVARYWNVKKVMCMGKSGSGYKFRIFGLAEATTGSQSIEIFYMLPGNKLQTAGAYRFPAITKGEPFQFDIVSAFTGYAPRNFIGFLIMDENLKVDEPEVEGTPAEALTDDISTALVVTDEDVAVTEVTAVTEVEDNEIYDQVETEPNFPGGLSAIFTHIAKNMRYPPIAAENSIQGKVIVSFVIEKDGSISNVEVANGANPYLDKEAVRVVKTLPEFSSPGKINGKPKRTKMKLPVTFRLE